MYVTLQPRAGALAREHFTNPAGTAHHDQMRKADEQSMFYDSGAAVELSGKLRGTGNGAEVTVKDHVALVGAILCAICGVANHVLSSQRLKVARRGAPAER